MSVEENVGSYKILYKFLPFPPEKFSRSISMVIDGKIFEKSFISLSKFSNDSTPTGQKILPKVPL